MKGCVVLCLVSLSTAVLGQGCSPSVCLNNGTCVGVDYKPSGYVCLCLATFSGENCETEIFPDPLPIPRVKRQRRSKGEVEKINRRRRAERMIIYIMFGAVTCVAVVVVIFNLFYALYFAPWWLLRKQKIEEKRKYEADLRALQWRKRSSRTKSVSPSRRSTMKRLQIHTSHSPVSGSVVESSKSWTANIGIDRDVVGQEKDDKQSLKSNRSTKSQDFDKGKHVGAALALVEAHMTDEEQSVLQGLAHPVEKGSNLSEDDLKLIKEDLRPIGKLYNKAATESTKELGENHSLIKQLPEPPASQSGSPDEVTSTTSLVFVDDAAQPAREFSESLSTMLTQIDPTDSENVVQDAGGAVHAEDEHEDFTFVT